jgi:streptogramin lyase
MSIYVTINVYLFGIGNLIIRLPIDGIAYDISVLSNAYGKNKMRLKLILICIFVHIFYAWAHADTYEYKTKWGSYGSGEGQLMYPVDTAVDSLRNIYVVDSENHRIQKFNSEGVFIAHWGSFGTGDGQFKYPFGAAVDASGNVYVADYGNDRIQKFNSEGAFITKWGSYGTGDGEFNNPFGITADASGDVYVSDSYNHRIQKFNSGGGFIAQWGSYGTGDGQFKYPDGVAVDLWGYVYVIDYGNHRIQKFGFSNEFRSLYVNRTGSGDGAVTSSSPGINCGTDCLGIYNFGTVLNLTATADSGSSFTGWSGDADCTDGVVNMNSNISCTAAFELLGNLDITKAGSGAGTVISSPAGIDCGADCSENYANGTVVTLTATAGNGSSFTGWSGDSDCNDGVVTMDSIKSCTATFDIVQYQLTTLVTPAGNGGVSPDCSDGCLYDRDTIVVLTANEDSGYPFSSWTGCDSSSTNGCTITMDAHKSVTASFDSCMYPARVIGTYILDFDYIQDAYDNSDTGETIESRYYIFIEDLILDRTITVIFKGGYDCSYETQTGKTKINGNMIISNGTGIIQSGTIEIQ